MDKKILLADDEAGIRKVLGIALVDSGYEVLTAEDGIQALEIFHQAKPDIVLTDIKMPGMDGIELLRKIKEENPETEVIMITGHGDMELAIKSLKYEATDFVTKPIHDEILEIALKRAHERMEMRAKLREHTENLEQLVREQSARLVKIERLAAVGQAVEGLSAAIRNMAGDFGGGIHYFNEMPCLVAIHSRELKIVTINQLYQERLGNLVGADSWVIYQGADCDRITCPAAKTLDSGQGQRTKATVRYLDGTISSVMVHTAPIHNSRGDLELVLEISADISEVEGLQEELRTTQKKHQQLFDEVPCYITVQTPTFQIAASNRRFKEDFGEATGSRCYEAYKNSGEPCEECPVAKTFRDGRSHQSETVVTAKSGAQYNVLINTAPIFNTAGKIEQVMEMSTNITEIRQLQDRLASLGLMVSSTSHSIKGILTGLDGGLYLLSSGISKKDNGQTRQGLGVVRQMAARIRNMVSNILYYAKDRALEWKRVDVAEFAAELIGLMQARFQNHPIAFEKQTESGLGGFEIDAAVMASALTNIIENAVEACLEDRSGRAHRIFFGVRQHKDNIVFEIRDNGIGMDQETVQDIFNLFYSSKGKRGTGLGLFIARNIVQQHAGRIEVDSTPGRGSYFRVMLPKVLPREAKENETRFQKEKQ